PIEMLATFGGPASGVGCASRLVPAENPQRTQRVPSAGPAVAVLEREMDRAGMGVLQEPRSVRLRLGPEQSNRFVDPRIRRLPHRAEMLQGAQHVVMPASRKRELQIRRIDDFAGALAPEQSPLEQVLLAPVASRDGFCRAPGGALVGP